MNSDIRTNDNLQRDDKKFIEFLKSFNEYYEPIRDISRNKQGHILVKSKFKMYNMDRICQQCKLFRDKNVQKHPKTTDALYYKITDEGELILHFIEFKGTKFTNQTQEEFFKKILNDLGRFRKNKKKKNNLNNYYFNSLKRIYNVYTNDIVCSLRLKPFETLYEALPVVYEEYCLLNEIPEDEMLNIFEFLNKTEKYLWTVSATTTKPKNRVRSHFDIMRRPENNAHTNVPKVKRNIRRMKPGTYEYKLEKHQFRLERAHVFEKCFLVDEFYFKAFIREYLMN